jgi:hypothetical protein
MPNIPDDGDGGWLRPKEVGLFKHVDPVYLKTWPKFAAEMSPSRQLHKEGHLAKDALAVAGLMELLGPPATEKAKEAEAFRCKYKGCTREYTDGGGSGSGTKYNCGYCSGKCREAAKKAPRSVARKCQHGRKKHRCKDCGTGYCQHGRRKDMCKDCGTGYPGTASTGARSESLASACSVDHGNHGTRKQIPCTETATETHGNHGKNRNSPKTPSKGRDQRANTPLA